MAIWVNYLIRTALVFENYIVQQILRSPGFHNTVRRIHRRVQERKYGRDPNEPLRPGEATELGTSDTKSFSKHFVQELLNQFRGTPSNPPPPPPPSGPPRKPR